VDVVGEKVFEKERAEVVLEQPQSHAFESTVKVMDASEEIASKMKLQVSRTSSARDLY
jgi:hypothetical protein